LKQNIDPLVLLLKIAEEKNIDEKWSNKPLYPVKILANSSKGDLAEAFITELCKLLGFKVEGGTTRLGDYDLEINNKKFEVKMATEDLSGNFQFNHLRYDYTYDWVLCLGISPEEILFEIYSKSDMATGKAGKLVSMGRGQNSSFKLTKPKGTLKPIDGFKERLLSCVGEISE